MKKTLYFFATPSLLLSLFVIPGFVFAANVSLTDPVTLVLPSDASSYTLTDGSFDQLDTGATAGAFSFTMAGGAVVGITDTGLHTLNNSLNVTPTCSSPTKSTVYMTLASGQPSQVVNVTPTGSCTSGSSSGGGNGPVSGGGGGGGGSSAPAPAPVTTPASQVAVAPTIAAPSTPPTSVITPSAPDSTSNQLATVSAQFKKTLQRGSRGRDVIRLQQLLALDKTIYPQGIVNGTYGPLTVAAVKRFQKRYGISPTGSLGPLTRAKILQVYGAK